MSEAQQTAARSLWSIARENDSADFIGAVVSINRAYDAYIKRTQAWQMDNGGIGAMNCVFMAAASFVQWCDLHVRFDDLEDAWPYLVEDKLGDALNDNGILDDFEAMYPEASLETWNRVAHIAAVDMGLPLQFDPALPQPILESIDCPVALSMFEALRLHSVREKIEPGPDGKIIVEQFTTECHPYDPDYGYVRYGFYGVLKEDKTLQHIMDFKTYEEAQKTLSAAYGRTLFPLVPKVLHRSTKKC